MAQIVLVFTLMALANIATALNCYTCNPCIKGGKVDEQLACGKIIDDPKTASVCLTESYIKKNDKTEVTERRCEVGKKQANGTITYACKNEDRNVTQCSICFSDLCNSGSFLKFSLVALFAAYLIPKFL